MTSGVAGAHRPGVRGAPGPSTRPDARPAPAGVAYPPASKARRARTKRCASSVQCRRIMNQFSAA